MSAADATPPASGRAVVRDAFRGTLFYSIPLLGQRLIGILVLSIVTRVLTRDDFGMLSLLDQVAVALGILIFGDYASALGYFYFQKSTAEDRAAVVGTSVFGSFLFGMLAMLIFWPLQGVLAREVFRTEEALRYLPVVLISLPFSFVLGPLLAYLRVEDRQGFFTRISLLRIVLNAGGIAVVVGVLKMRVLGYVTATLLVTVVVTVLLVVYVFQQARPTVSLHLFVQMFRFSVPLTLNLVAVFVVSFGDQFILRHYRSLSEVGIYALAYRIGMLVSVAYTAFEGYWTAQLYRIMNMDDADTVFARLFTYVVLSLSTVFLALTLGAVPGLHILVARDFRIAAPLIPVIAAANGIRHLGAFVRGRFLAVGRPGYQTWCGIIGLIVCVVLYFTLIPPYGMWGAAIATIVSFFVVTVISLIWTYRIGPYHVEGARLLKLASVIAPIVALYYGVPGSGSLVWQLAWSALLLALLPAGLWALGFATPGERQVMRSALARMAKYPRRF